MCTVSLIARKNGYALAMNRDEKKSRVVGCAPKKITIEGRAILSPSEPGAGTWIALNDAGVTFALINWYAIPPRRDTQTVSRGSVVNAVRATNSAEAAAARLAELPLARMNSFRLIGIFPKTQEVVEWRWNKKLLVRKNHRWQTQQWISSGFDEPQAQRIRSATFRRALGQKSASELAWLRRLHRSHAPEPGPFATCMHRADAATVSYTEVIVTASRRAMAYCPSAPCVGGRASGWVRLAL